MSCRLGSGADVPGICMKLVLQATILRIGGCAVYDEVEDTERTTKETVKGGSLTAVHS